MKKAILARKVGMTQVFDDSGRAVPVTVLQAGPCRIIQKRTPEKDGYQSLQLGFEELSPDRLNRPLQGHFKKNGARAYRVLQEFRFKDADSFQPGEEIKADVFSSGDYVDITGISKGKGFAGSIKRHGFGRGPMSHGSHYHRGPGSLGSIDAARVFKGTKLPGRMGGRKTTVLNLQVVKVDAEQNILLVRGAVPGPRGSLLKVREAVKKTG